MQVDWGADFEDEEDESLQDEFGRVLDETIEQRLGQDPEAEDTEVCAQPVSQAVPAQQGVEALQWMPCCSARLHVLLLCLGGKVQ